MFVRSWSASEDIRIAGDLSGECRPAFDAGIVADNRPRFDSDVAFHSDVVTDEAAESNVGVEFVVDADVAVAAFDCGQWSDFGACADDTVGDDRSRLDDRIFENDGIRDDGVCPDGDVIADDDVAEDPRAGLDTGVFADNDRLADRCILADTRGRSDHRVILGEDAAIDRQQVPQSREFEPQSIVVDGVEWVVLNVLSERVGQSELAVVVGPPDGRENFRAERVHARIDEVRLDLVFLRFLFDVGYVAGLDADRTVLSRVFDLGDCEAGIVGRPVALDQSLDEFRFDDSVAVDDDTVPADCVFRL